MLQIVFGFAISFFFSSSASEIEGETLTSPDGKYLATITASGFPNGEPRSRIYIRPASGPGGRAFPGYASKDGEHGATISSAAWTSNSRFLVFILEHSGGRSPLIHPIFFWDRSDNEVKSLDKKIGSITSGFTLSNPDIVRALRLDSKLEPEEFQVSLSSIALHYTEGDEETCRAQGGTYKPLGRRGKFHCITPYPDGGKKCTDTSQCLGGCFVDLAKWTGIMSTGTVAVGICRRDNSGFGCHVPVLNGRIREGMCAD